MTDLRRELEGVIATLQSLLASLPGGDLPSIVADAIATKATTRGHQADLVATAKASLAAGEDPIVIADAIYQGVLGEDPE